MKKAMVLIILCSASLLAEPREVKLRLLSAQTLTSVRIVPRGETAIGGIVIKVPASISVASQSNIQKTATAGSIRVTGSFSIEAPGNPMIALEQPLEIRLDGKGLQLVIDDPLEEYVAAVLSGEAGTFQSMESLRAMAVAIRTFAVRFGDRHRKEGFELCDSTHCQVFRTTAIGERFRNAAESTEGEILWFNGRPAETYYHQDCGGHTEDAGSMWPGANLPYLRSQNDSFCIARGGSSWTADLTTEELRRAIGATAVEIAGRTPSGRVRQLRLTGGSKAQMTSEAFRVAVGRVLGWNRVRSDNYELREDGGLFRFEGRGSGHGVGLCQAGAAQMGNSGRNYRDILAFYYPGTKLGITAQGLTWQRLNGERIELQTTRPTADRRIIGAADRLVRQVEESLGRRFNGRPAIRVFPSVPVFRDSTGEPGWIAASTRGSMVRLQPLETLGAGVEGALHHELVHVLIEQHAAPTLPRWFREGMALVLTDSSGATSAARAKNPSEVDRALLNPKTREEFFQAYASAKGLVTQLISTHGRKTVLTWISTGLPANLNLTPASSQPKR